MNCFGTINNLTLKGMPHDNSLDGWTKVPSTGGVVINYSFGNPAPCIQATVNNAYAYINANTIFSGLTTFWGRQINLDMYCGIPGGLVDFFFACNSTGAGKMFRLDCRSNNYSGITTSNSWTGLTVPNAVLGLPGNTWYNIQIIIGSAGNAKFNYKAQSSGTYISYTTGVAVPASQTYIGIQSDGVNGGYIDNISII